MQDTQILTLLRQLSEEPQDERKLLARWTHGRPLKADWRTALPPIPHSRVLLQGGTQSCNLLCQALQYRILHLSLVRTVEALERVRGIQGIHLRRKRNKKKNYIIYIMLASKMVSCWEFSPTLE